MENLLIVKDVTDLTGITTLEAAVTAMAIGDVIALGDGHTIVGRSIIPTGVSRVQLITKLKNGETRISVSIPRSRISRINTQEATSYTAKVLTMAGTGAGEGFVLPTTGEGFILLKNLSYNHSIATQTLSVSVIKKASETLSAYLDRVVTKITDSMALQGNVFCTVAKINSGTEYALAFTTTDYNVDLFVGVNGIFEEYPAVVTQEMEIPFGQGKDILAMEKVMSRHLGNHGYVENTDLWYSAGFQAEEGKTYDVMTINWEGISPTPTNTIKVANNVLQLGVDTTGNLARVTALVNSLSNTINTIVIDGDTDSTDGISDE